MTTVLAVYNSEGCVGRCDAKHYVYVLRDPRPGKNRQPFYVGKGSGNRVRMHLWTAETHYNRFMKAVLGKILGGGLEPIIEITHRCDDEAEAYRLEVELIALYGRRDIGLGSLCNLTDGGEGVTGHSTSPEDAQKASQRLIKLHKNPDFAKAHAERWSAIMSQRNAERRESNRDLMRKRNADPEYRARCLSGRADLWSDERVNQLKLLHSEGVVFREIAAKLGVHRGAISGKVSKLGLPRRRR